MRISGPRATQRQLTFWPKGIASIAETRNHCGEFAETLTAAVSGGVRLKTDGRADYCPDIDHGDNTYGECKSVGKNRQVIIYEARREKDRRFVAAGHKLYYWFWHHKLNVKVFTDVETLNCAWLESLQYGVLLPFAVVDGMMAARPLRLLNSAYSTTGKRLGYGSDSKGYGWGRSIPVSTFLQSAPFRIDSQAIPLYTLEQLSWLVKSK
jgi:hypothetical protein